MSLVHYRFKSEVEKCRTTIHFDGPTIMCRELKARINAARRADHIDFDLELRNAIDPAKIYADGAAIPRHTSLVVRRIPRTYVVYHDALEAKSVTKCSNNDRIRAHGTGGRKLCDSAQHTPVLNDKTKVKNKTTATSSNHLLLSTENNHLKRRMSSDDDDMMNMSDRQKEPMLISHKRVKL